MNYQRLFLLLFTCSAVAVADSTDVFTTNNDDAIRHQQDVESECNDRCSSELGQWTGHWQKIDSSHSVCHCNNLPRFSTHNDDPIWSHDHAEENCPSRCEDEDGHWTGGWWTTVWGQHSVCECVPTHS